MCRSMRGGPLGQVSSRLHIQFTTEAEFRAEFLANIVNGGIFVTTEYPPRLRARVTVDIQLSYCNEVLQLDGEVVHCVPAELAATGASPGVAIHFDDNVTSLRAKFAPHVNTEPHKSEKAKSDPRRARRFAASVATRISTSADPERKGGVGRTRNISRYGALVDPFGDPVPIGEAIKITITHPSTGEELEVDATVQRHEVSESGSVTGLGVEFHLPDAKAEAESSARFLEDVQRREYSRRLGAITGPIEELGIPTLLTMFGSCADGGTLTVTRDSEEGSIVFQGGMLRGARLASASGLDALARMLAWQSGFFDFEAHVDPERFQGDPVPLEQALNDALHSREERRPEKVRLRANTKLRVDVDAVQEAGSDLSETDRAILELAGTGVTVGKIFEVIPESKSDVTRALSNLVKRGLISPT